MASLSLLAGRTVTVDIKFSFIPVGILLEKQSWKKLSHNKSFQPHCGDIYNTGEYDEEISQS